MPHPYPRHLRNFPYVGRLRYSLEFTTFERSAIFLDARALELVLPHILRAAREKGFARIAYCFMRDHLHLVIEGLNDGSDCRAFIKAAKQFSGYYFKKERRRQLWAGYGYERFIRDEMELALTIRYLLANPVKAGLVDRPEEYPLLGSARYSVMDLLQISEYSDACVLD
jgi:putative transposase